MTDGVGTVTGLSAGVRGYAAGSGRHCPKVGERTADPTLNIHILRPIEPVTSRRVKERALNGFTKSTYPLIAYGPASIGQPSDRHINIGEHPAECGIVTV